MLLLTRSTTLSSREPRSKGIPKTTIVKTTAAGVLVLITLGIIVIPRQDADFDAACQEVAISLGNELDVCTAEYSPDTEPQPYINNTLKDVINTPVCSGYQKSTASQWMNPLANWVLPGLSLLLLVPTAERGAKTINEHDYFKGVWDSLKEWCKILGDPASCFCGTFSEFTTDIRILSQDLPVAEKAKDALAIKVCALIGQLKWTEETGLALRFLKGYSKSAPYGRDAMRIILGGRVRFLASVLLPVVMYTGAAMIIIYEARELSVGDNDTSHMLAYGIWYLWLLALAVLSNCYGAHISTEAIQAALQSMLQQITAIKDPALEEIQKEAYIALLSELHPELCTWILQTKYNEDLGRRFNQEEDTILRKQFENDPFRLASLRCETRKLHGRYLDNKMWKRWLDGLPRDIDKPQKPPNPREPIESQTHDDSAETLDQNFTSVECAELEAQAQVETFLDRRELFRYLLYQFMGWIPIALACGFAATISWTTPRVSLACRSLNHILYALFTFLSAIIYAILQYLRYNHSADRSGYPFPPKPLPELTTPTRTYRIYHPILNVLYHALVQINTFTFLAGTLFQLAGVFRSCFCKIGIVALIQYTLNTPGWADTEVQWGRDTRIHREMSIKVWVPIVTTAWFLIATACFGGIGIKEWIMRKLRKSGKEVVQKGQLKDTQTEANWSDGDDDEGDVWDANVEDNKSCHEMSGDGSELDEKGVCDHGTCSRCGNTGGVRIRVYRVTSKDG